MKRKVLLLLVIVIAMLNFTACGRFECDFCGEEKSGKAYAASVWGEEVTICKECKDEIKELQSVFD